MYFRKLNFRGWLLGNHIYVKYSLFSVLLGYIWLLGTIVNSSCDIKINVNIVQNCCRNLVVRGLFLSFFLFFVNKVIPMPLPIE